MKVTFEFDSVEKFNDFMEKVSAIEIAEAKSKEEKRNPIAPLDCSEEIRNPNQKPVLIPFFVTTEKPIWDSVCAEYSNSYTYTIHQ